MKKQASLLACLALCIALCACGGSNDASNQQAPSENASTENSATEATTEASPDSEEYYWDTHEADEMPYVGSDNYMADVVMSEEPIPVAADDDGNYIATMQAILPDPLVMDMGKNNGSEYTAARTVIDKYYDDDDHEYLALSYDFEDNELTLEEELSSVLESHYDMEWDDFSADIVPETYKVSGLMKKTVNGSEVLYVCEQFEEVETGPNDEQITLCGERFYAGMPFTAPNGKTVRVWVEISNARLNPEDLANDGILDLVFGTFEASSK